MILQILLRVSEIEILAKCFEFYICVAILLILICLGGGGSDNNPKTK